MCGWLNARGSLRRFVAVLLVVTMLAASAPHCALALEPETTQSETGQPDTTQKVKNFVDKWIINGNAIGNAIGAVVGSMLFGLVFPGPVGLVAGSFIGSTLGGFIGAAIDDRVGIAVNYAAFNRPALTSGGVWLEGVGPWEQAFYQFDNWVLNGGNLASMACHLTLSFAARTIPGAACLAGPIFLMLADYVVGNVGDNIDGLIDLGLVGRKIDEARGQAPVVATEAADRPAGDGSSDGDANLRLRDSYQSLLQTIKDGTRENAAQALEGFRNVKDSIREAIVQRRGDATAAP